MRSGRARRAWLVLATLVLGVSAGAGAPAAMATAPGANGRLVISTVDPTGTFTQLVTMNADGSGRVVLPTGAIPNPDGPSWSPDGGRLAFRSYDSAAGVESLWVAGADGSNPQKVVEGHFSYAWSPDGSRLALAPNGFSDAVTVVTLSSAAQQTIPLVQASDGSPTALSVGSFDWSPDGATLAVTGTEPGGTPFEQLFTVDMTTGAVRRLTSGPLADSAYPGGNQGPDWSPSGQTILFTCPLSKYKGDICRIRPDGTGLAILTESSPATYPFDDSSDFRSAVNSPDGTKIAVANDGALEIRNSSAASPVVVDTGGSPVFTVDWQTLPPPPNADADGDGVVDAIDTGARTFADANTPPPTGAILDDGGLAVTVTDAAAPDGVTVSTGAGAATARARLQVCGFTVLLAPGSNATFTCGSISVRTTTGMAEIVSPGGLQTTPVPAGAAAKFTATTSGGYTVTQTAGAALRTFVGFDAPVDDLGVVNEVKAGRAIPLKWKVTTAAGAPVTTIAAATVTAAAVPCAAGAAVDAVEETLADGSGLKNLGNGSYSINWKSPTSYAGTCKRIRVDLGGGLAGTALFRFTR